MGRSYTEEEKAFLSQATAPSSSGGLQIASTSLMIQNEDKRKCNNQRQLILDPTGNTLYYWLFIVAAGVIYNCWTLIFRISFFETNEDVLIWMICDYLVDFVYLLDMFAASRTGFLLEGILQNDTKQLRMHYIKTTYFCIDILSVLPFELFRIRVTYDPVYRLNRLLKFYRFWYFLDRFESRTKYPNIFRLASLSQFILVAIHWNACIYFLLSRHLGFGSNQWVYPGIEGKMNLTASYSSMTRKYIYSFYWSTLTLTTIGVPHPNNNIGYVFVTIDYLIGVLLFATIVGNVGSIVSNTKMARVKFQSQMDKLKKYMYAHKIPKRLNQHVIKWFDYLWTSKQHADDEGVLAALPHKLRAEIAIHVHLDSLKKVEIFQNCEAGFLCELVLKLKPQLISPGDFVCHKGEVGREMYIVNRGKLEVVSDDVCNVLCTLQAGSYFGEISILDLGGRDGNRRTASVRSVGYSDLFQLSKQDLIEVLKDYPELKGKIEKNAREKLERDRKRKISTKIDRPDLALRECYQKTTEEMTMQIDILKRSNAELAQELFHVKCVYDERIANLESALGVLLRKHRNESNSRS